MNDTYGLGDVADEIDGLRGQLESAYERRVVAILEALADGRSLRDIATHLRMSHTAVAKALDGLKPAPVPQACRLTRPRTRGA